MLRFDGLFGVNSLSEPMLDQSEIEPLENVCEIVMKTHQIKWQAFVYSVSFIDNNFRASQNFFRPPYFFSALKSAVILRDKVLGIGIISSLFFSFSLLITAK